MHKGKNCISKGIFFIFEIVCIDFSFILSTSLFDFPVFFRIFLILFYIFFTCEVFQFYFNSFILFHATLFL